MAARGLVSSNVVVFTAGAAEAAGSLEGRPATDWGSVLWAAVGCGEDGGTTAPSITASTTTVIFCFYFVCAATATGFIIATANIKPVFNATFAAGVTIVSFVFVLNSELWDALIVNVYVSVSHNTLYPSLSLSFLFQSITLSMSIILSSLSIPLSISLFFSFLCPSNTLFICLSIFITFLYDIRFKNDQRIISHVR